jgi:glycosyltransferase involved in cell wall biosynthesis
LLFVGSLFYQPNVDAVRWLLDALAPELRRRGLRFHLTIAGRSPPQALIDLAAKDNDCDLQADLPSLEPLYVAAHIVLCPIRSGGGTRIKVLEALSFGRPVVCTRIGAEGLDLRSDVEVVYAESAAEFVDRIVQLQTEAGLAHRLAAQGLARIRSSYSIDSLVERLRIAHGVPAD